MMGKKQNTRTLEKYIKGVSNHRRIEILFLLGKSRGLSVDSITQNLKTNYKTVSEHVRRLYLAGLVAKRTKGTSVLHSLTPRGEVILKFLRTLE